MPQSFTDAERASPNGTAAQSKTPLHDTDHGANSKSASFPSPRSGPSASTVDPRGFPHGSNFAQKLPRKSQLSTKLCPPLCPCAERSVNAANAVHLATPLLCSPSTRDRSGTLRWPSGPNGATDDHFNFQHRSRLQVAKLGGRKGRGTHQPTSPRYPSTHVSAHRLDRHHHPVRHPKSCGRRPQQQPPQQRGEPPPGGVRPHAKSLSAGNTELDQIRM